MKKVVTWVVVADHQHARFFQNEGPDRGIQLLENLTIDTHLGRSSDILTDKSGRSVSSRYGQRHGFELPTDPHRQEGVAFIGRIAGVVKKGADEHVFDRLILIAPPRALGELRDSLPDSVRGKVIGELAEDLVKASPLTILGHLGKYIAA